MVLFADQVKLCSRSNSKGFSPLTRDWEFFAKLRRREPRDKAADDSIDLADAAPSRRLARNRVLRVVKDANMGLSGVLSALHLRF